MSTSAGPSLPSWFRRPLQDSGQQSRVLPEPAESRVSLFANAVYYPNYRIYRQQPPSSLSLGHISHVFYAFARLATDGTVYLSDAYADAQIEVDGTNGCLNALTNLKQQYPLLKVILSIGGGGPGSAPFAEVASSGTTRNTFAMSARTLIDEYGLDGIDIDWEHPSDAQQGHDYLQLLAAARAYLPSPVYILTSALPAGTWALQHIDLSLASLYLDIINLMAYDFCGPWLDATGHQAQLFAPQRPHNDAAMTSGHSAVTYMRSRGVPASKILLGIPAYGRSFTGATNTAQRYAGSGGEGGTFEYRDLPRPGAQEYVDTHVGAAYCVGGDGGFVTYDNARTVQMKANYVTQNQLGGLFYWTGTADAQSPRSLVETGYNALHDL
ncbi:MAG: class V [Lasallia pustulata]|uniref:chitinase n=1 Tax=Lasallia pustulata TaxID=136370 RepID=A0A5M8Q4S0_9LECA|nr:MAG: class V [Lasallia pustulata]